MDCKIIFSEKIEEFKNSNKIPFLNIPNQSECRSYDVEKDMIPFIFNKKKEIRDAFITILAHDIANNYTGRIFYGLIRINLPTFGSHRIPKTIYENVPLRKDVALSVVKQLSLPETIYTLQKDKWFEPMCSEFVSQLFFDENHILDKDCSKLSNIDDDFLNTMKTVLKKYVLLSNRDLSYQYGIQMINASNNVSLSAKSRAIIVSDYIEFFIHQTLETGFLFKSNNTTDNDADIVARLTVEILENRLKENPEHFLLKNILHIIKIDNPKLKIQEKR